MQLQQGRLESHRKKESLPQCRLGDLVETVEHLPQTFRENASQHDDHGGMTASRRLANPQIHGKKAFQRPTRTAHTVSVISVVQAVCSYQTYSQSFLG